MDKTKKTELTTIKDESRKEIGARIKKRRKELGMTQKELAEKIMKKEITIRQYESGARFPDLTTRMLIVTALDCKYEDLFPPESLSSLMAAQMFAPIQETVNSMTAQMFEPIQGVLNSARDSMMSQIAQSSPEGFTIGSGSTESLEASKPKEASTPPTVDTSGLTDREIHELQIYRDFLIFRRGQSAKSSPDSNPDS